MKNRGLTPMNPIILAVNALDQQRWIGLASITPQETNDILGECCAAFVPVVGDAKNKDEFTKLLEIEFAKLEFNLEALEDVETLAQRLEGHKLPDELEAAIEYISSDHSVAFGTFHAY